MRQHIVLKQFRRRRRMLANHCVAKLPRRAKMQKFPRQFHRMEWRANQRALYNSLCRADGNFALADDVASAAVVSS